MDGVLYRIVFDLLSCVFFAIPINPDQFIDTIAINGQRQFTPRAIDNFD
jgi:hypothetical protein